MQSEQKLPTLREFKRIPEFKPLKPDQLRMISALISCDLRVEKAAKKAGIEWRNHYNWLHHAIYKQAVEYAKEILADSLESTMLDDALQGRETAIVYKGAVTGYFREVNASERIVMLKGLRQQYRESFNVAASAGPSLVNVVLNQSPPQPLVSDTTITAIEDKKS